MIRDKKIPPFRKPKMLLLQFLIYVIRMMPLCDRS